MEQALRVDRIACDGYGMCAELLPEMIESDDWGYPMVSNRPVPDWLEPLAKQAVESCPVLALRLVSQSAPQPGAGQIRRFVPQPVFVRNG